MHGYGAGRKPGAQRKDKMANVLPPERRRNIPIQVRLTRGDAALVSAAYDRFIAGDPEPIRPLEYHRLALIAGANALEEAKEAEYNVGARPAG